MDTLVQEIDCTRIVKLQHPTPMWDVTLNRRQLEMGHRDRTLSVGVQSLIEITKTD